MAAPSQSRPIDPKVLTAANEIAKLVEGLDFNGDRTVSFHEVVYFANGFDPEFRNAILRDADGNFSARDLWRYIGHHTPSMPNLSDAIIDQAFNNYYRENPNNGEATLAHRDPTNQLFPLTIQSTPKTMLFATGPMRDA